MSRVALFGVIFGIVGCGSGFSSPTSPTTTALPSVIPAKLQVSGDQGQWMACLSIGVGGIVNCDFKGELRNVGTGCASAVTGVTRFYNASNEQIGEAVTWHLAVPPVIQPEEVVSYRSPSVPASVVHSTAHYFTEAQWTNVPCPGAIPA